jgi:hypothetical protein
MDVRFVPRQGVRNSTLVTAPDVDDAVIVQGAGNGLIAAGHKKLTVSPIILPNSVRDHDARQAK